MIAARVLKDGHQGEGSRVARASTRAFGSLQATYLRAFDSTLRHRKLVGFLTVASIGVAIWGFTRGAQGLLPDRGHRRDLHRHRSSARYRL